MKTFFAFLAGAAIGAGTVYLVMKDKVQKELDEIASEFAAPVDEEASIEQENAIGEAQMMDIYRETISQVEYKQAQEKDLVAGPRMIPMTEFGSDETYESHYWNLYTDGVITNDKDDWVESPEKHIGTAYKDYMKFDPDILTAYVANDQEKAYYEITKMDMPYEDEEYNDIYEIHHPKKGIDYDDDDEDDE